MAKFHFSLVSPERELYAGEVDQVDAPGAEGDFGVFQGHEPFMTTLRSGPVTVFVGGGARLADGPAVGEAEARAAAFEAGAVGIYSHECVVYNAADRGTGPSQPVG